MMGKVKKEYRLEYYVSYKAQGRHIVMYGVTYFNQIIYDMDLCDNNYHLIVNLLVKLLDNRVGLRVEAPEWHPIMEKIDGNVQDNESVKEVQDYCTSNDSGSVKLGKDEKWRKSKKVVRTMNYNKVKTSNQMEIILKFYVILMMIMMIMIEIMIMMMKKLTMGNTEIIKMSMKKNVHVITWKK